jgi:hypothetical protein
MKWTGAALEAHARIYLPLKKRERLPKTRRGYRLSSESLNVPLPKRPNTI